ncbi:zinc finger CCHC domain-containing protein 7 isoform X2 [Quillaja saponaria]|uniref:Zinc finger CCHC domain-containing protein 7 isoform X2 n=1 Tax=Quillaja saponaria TaxID=32244 RepID=A0AAD7PQV2_QUISA|nr:zinc finger CCHC domain-containing protein 7 isoform X2 [Quillaja saponaria]
MMLSTSPACQEGGVVGVVESPSSSTREAEIVAEPRGVGDGIVASDVVYEKNVGAKLEKKKVEYEEQTAVVSEAKEIIETTEAKDKAESVEGNSALTNANIVLRKLLRGPRYFDPPDSGWGACYNCGEEGHTAVNCKSAKRKKPCFVCGSLEHNARQCSKGQDCFICRKGGHRAKDCPEKHKGGSQSSRICLKCGNSGHNMFSCKNDYPPDDFKEIQCYICYRFGHLCCVNSVDNTPGELSCYKCGQLGHTGLACSSLRGETTVAQSPNSCYKCGEGGHFARECMSSAKRNQWMQAFPSFRGETTGAGLSSSCYKCGEGGHFARECMSSTKHNQWTQPFPSLRGDTSGAGSPSSCYKCGEEGHFARECMSFAEGNRRMLACPSLREETSVAGSPSLCYKCGKGGHFARECNSSAKGGKRNREIYSPRTPTLRFHREQNDYMGYQSVPNDMSKARKRRKVHTEERGFTTSKKSKHRGGWVSEDPGDFSPIKYKKNQWRSPATPFAKGNKSSGGSHFRSSRSPKKVQKVHRGTFKVARI